MKRTFCYSTPHVGDVPCLDSSKFCIRLWENNLASGVGRWWSDDIHKVRSSQLKYIGDVDDKNVQQRQYQKQRFHSMQSGSVDQFRALSEIWEELQAS